MVEETAWPSGQSGIATLIRNTNWAATPLGPIHAWPQALRTAVELTLASPVAAIVLWGPQRIQIYNHLWTALHPGKHPAAMGQPTHQCFSQLINMLEPVYQRADRGEGVVLEDSLLPIPRRNTMADAWWNVVYTPVRSDSGAVDGIFCTLAETTSKVLAEQLTANDTVLGHAGVSTDVQLEVESGQALHESEERFRLFVENVREYAFVQTDFDGVVTSWNPGAERLFGYTSEEIVGLPFVSLLPIEDRASGLIAREMARVATGQKNEDAHFFARKDGSRFWCEWITEPVFDDTGKLRGTAKVMRDETERQQVEKTLRASLLEKESLLSEIHHRVKNNLQVVTSLLNLQSRRLKDDEALTLFNETRNRVQSISSIHELLYRSSSFAEIDLVTYAQRLVPGLIRFYGAQKRVKFRITGKDVALELERAVPFGLLLNELISNSLKHGFANEMEGSLSLTFHREPGMVHFGLQDTGKGLPPDFQPAEQTSLGLRLIHILVRQLSGQIQFKSQTGTNVEVQIPAPARAI